MVLAPVVCLLTAFQQAAPGQLSVVGKDGALGVLCPLKETTVNAEIAGFGARVTLVQKFTNPTQSAIEAIYTFPLPADAAVDRMRIRVGNRVIAGVIKPREEAQAIYEAAKAQGKIAALLDQERPNIFTQSVANIMPSATIEVEISYVQLLKYEDGFFEFSFPMTVGPRYIPAGMSDPEKVAPPTLSQNMRSGAGIRLNVSLDAGAPIQSVNSVLHKVTTRKVSDTRMTVSLAKSDEIPNRDFILRYSCATDTVQSALLTHADENGGTFALVLLPPKTVKPETIQPREVIFVMDQSGSQNGFPMQKSIELTTKLIDTLGPQDSFNVVSFADKVASLWPIPRENTPEARAEAKTFVAGLKANGGTQLAPAVEAALAPTPDPRRLRVVVFNTDGFVGNDFEVLKKVQEHRGHARMFTFGIGNGVNRFLIDAMSVEGRGDSEIVTLAESADAAVERFVRRVRYPILTDVNLEVEGGGVTEVLPRVLPDVFSEKPIVVFGRYAVGGKATFTLTGVRGGRPYANSWEVMLPKADKDGSAITTLWAKSKVEEIMRTDWIAHQSRTSDSRATAEITEIGLRYGIMTQYTSFVAVEERIVNVGGKQRRVHVPVEMTEGVALGETWDGRAMRRSSGTGFGGGGMAPTGQPASASVTKSANRVLEDKEQTNTSTPLTPEQKRQQRYETVVAKALRDASGKVEVQIMLSKWDAKDIEELKRLGFKLEAKDEKALVVFGTVDAKRLIDIAQIMSMVRITKV